MSTACPASPDLLPLHVRTPSSWASGVLNDPIALLADHAFLERKAANNALELLTRWPEDWVPGWVETMTAVARDETAHLAQVTRLLIRRGGKLPRLHKNPYANELRMLVRSGDPGNVVDRLLVSALIEARSCERFALLADAAPDNELSTFYRSLFSSEFGHYRVFLHLTGRIVDPKRSERRWQELLEAEGRIISGEPAGPRIHSGWTA